MKKYFILISFFFIAGIVHSQKETAIIKTIKQINSISKEAYIFPKVIIPNNMTVTLKINNALLEFLDIENGSYKKGLFENVWQSEGDERKWIYSDLNFKVVENSSKILAINVWATFGKHNTENTEHYLFDVSTGNRITLDTLILAEKRKSLAQLIYAKKNSIIYNFLKQVNDSLIIHQQKNDSTEVERDLYQIDNYNRCIESLDTSNISLEYVVFYYEANKIHFTLEQCFCWAANAYDDLGEYRFEFNIIELKPYLSSYAGKLFYQ